MAIETNQFVLYFLRSGQHPVGLPQAYSLSLHLRPRSPVANRHGFPDVSTSHSQSRLHSSPNFLSLGMHTFSPGTQQPLKHSEPPNSTQVPPVNSRGVNLFVVNPNKRIVLPALKVPLGSNSFIFAMKASRVG
mmetsp:Transcript_11160/g.17068  ORF Transcript_11160/g.17068 Transcript_11160/m.17068 type:complete len:133 (-) Transcript_11160:1222-1620(-)